MNENEDGRKIPVAPNELSDDADHDDASEERSLWVSVIWLAVMDLEKLVRHIVRFEKKNPNPYQYEAYSRMIADFKTLEYEMSHEWMSIICDYCDYDHAKLLRHLQSKKNKIKGLQT